MNRSRGRGPLKTHSRAILEEHWHQRSGAMGLVRYNQQRWAVGNLALESGSRIGGNPARRWACRWHEDRAYFTPKPSWRNIGDRRRGAMGSSIIPRSAWMSSVASDRLLSLAPERKPRPASGGDGTCSRLVVGHPPLSLVGAILSPPARPSVVVFSKRAGLPPIRDPDSRARFPAG